MVLLGSGIVLLIYVPATILGVFVAARVLDISFGDFWPAVLKIAAICVFANAIQDVGGTVVRPLLGWCPGPDSPCCSFTARLSACPSVKHSPP